LFPIDSYFTNHQSFLLILDHSTAIGDAKSKGNSPIQCEHTIEFGGIIRRPENIVIHLSIPKDFYVCGEFIDAVMHVENKTVYHTIEGIGLALMQHIHASIGGHAKTENKTIAFEKFRPNIQHGKSEEIKGKLQIPNNLLPTQTGRLISVQYQIEIIGDDENFQSQTWIPVTIIGNY